MDCRNFQKNLESYLEGGLDFPGRVGMERHAQQCFGCGQELAGAQKLAQMARELKRVSAPPDFEAAVLNKIRSREMHSRFRTLRRFWIYGFDYFSPRAIALGASALAFLGLGIALHFYRAGHVRQMPGSLISGTVSSSPGSGLVPATPDTAPAADEETAGNSARVFVKTSRARSSGSAVENGFSGQIEASEYGEYVVPGFGDGQMTVRLPKTIRLRYGQPSEEYYIRNVSH